MSDATRNFTAATEFSSISDGASGAGESVGGMLRKAREERGLSLPQASRDLCLKEEILRALESRQYSALPKVPYCFGFVRTYARYLALEPEEMVRRFKREIGDVPATTKLAPPVPIRPGRFPGRAAVTMSVLIAAAAYGTWYFYTERPAAIAVPTTTADAHAPMAPVPLIDPELAKRLNAETDRASKEETPDPAKSNATTSATPAEKGVVIKALGACWVYIHDQKGKVVFHKTMQKGEEFRVPADQKGLILELGNPLAAQIIVDGRPLKPLSATPNKAARQSLDAKDLAKLP